MEKTSVGTTERWVSALGGGALVLWGLRHRALARLAAVTTGAALAWRGLSGRSRIPGLPGTARAASAPTVGNLGVKVDHTLMVSLPPERVYRFWRNLENLPHIMSHLERVETLGPTRSRWHAKAVAGVPLAWEAEIINDLTPSLIAWRTVPGGPVAHAGSVRFLPAGEGTRIDVSLQYDPPGGALGHAVAAMLGDDAGARIARDLTEFKQALESGRLAA
jgi:uncharacterized membrane protein